MAATPGTPHDPNGRGRRKGVSLIPIIVVVAALLAGFLIFNLTRAQPNYEEEQVPGPDPVETST